MSCSDIISVISLIVNSLLAIWVVIILQKNLTNKRYLKDHLITEVKNLREDYKKFLNELYCGNLKPDKITPWFKLMNIKVQGVMKIIYQKYKIDEHYLENYQVELRELVTDLKEFNENYKDNKPIVLDSNSEKELIQFQQNNSSKFNDLIIKINDK